MHPLLANKLVVALVSLSAAAGAGAAALSADLGMVLAEEVAAPDRADGAVFAGMQARDIKHSFYFTRLEYPSGRGGGRGGGWGTDWPTADHTIIAVLGRLTSVDIYPREHSVRLDSDDLRRFPFIYAVEVGSMNLRDNEAESLRNYLLAGGFLVVDDFWGSYQWANFEAQIRKVFPDHEIVDIPLDHPIFSTVYEVDEIVQVPVVDQGIRGGPTHEQDGYVPHCFGIFDEDGRLMVVINWNTDLGDAWEHAENPRYPLDYSTYAYRMGANFIYYAMTR
jgi:hypothetical protein